MKITPDLLISTMGCTSNLANSFANFIDEACQLYEINTSKRLAAFISQIGHESGSLRYVREIWGPTPVQSRYEGRTDLGNTQPGDGKKFCGHGLIQITGRYNHIRIRDRLRSKFSSILVPDFETDPDALCEPQWSALAATDYWDDHNLNDLADTGDIIAIGRAINRGNAKSNSPANGESDRLVRYKKALQILQVSSDSITVADNTPSQEKPMLPFVAAGIMSLIQSAPALIRVFGDSPQAEKNAKVAEVVSDIAKKVTGEVTVEGAVNAINADPVVAAQFREQIHVSMDDLMSMIERVNAIDQANIVSARSYNKDESAFIKTSWIEMKFIHLLSILFITYSGYFVNDHWESLTPELRGAIITLMIIAGWNGVRDYWMGSSSGSDSKNAMLMDKNTK